MAAGASFVLTAAKKCRNASGVTAAYPYLWWGRAIEYSTPLAKTFQIIRAVLLACPTAATNFPRRWMTCCSQSFRHWSGVAIVRPHQMQSIRAPWIRSLRIYVFPRLLIPSNFCLPPDECSRGVNPRHAANWRPFLNCLAFNYYYVIIPNYCEFWKKNEIGLLIFINYLFGITNDW